MIKLLTGLQYGGVIACLLLGTGIDYPASPDGFSWWNLWLAFAGLGVTALATFAKSRLKRHYTRLNARRARRMYWEMERG